MILHRRKNNSKRLRPSRAGSTIFREVPLLPRPGTHAGFVKEGLSSEEELGAHYDLTLGKIEALEMRNMLRGSEDKLEPLWISIRVRAETRAWTGPRCFCACTRAGGELNGYKVRSSTSRTAKRRESVCNDRIRRDYAYGYLKSENGVHRLVRLSPFNANNKRIRLSLTVFVRQRWTTASKSRSIRRRRVGSYRGGGAGVRNVNKVETGVRLRYKYKDPDSGEVTELPHREHRDPFAVDEPENAMRSLKSKLYQRELHRRLSLQNQLEAQKKKIEWGSQIRSYVFDDRRVKESPHRPPDPRTWIV